MPLSASLNLSPLALLPFGRLLPGTGCTSASRSREFRFGGSGADADLRRWRLCRHRNPGARKFERRRRRRRHEGVEEGRLSGRDGVPQPLDVVEVAGGLRAPGRPGRGLLIARRRPRITRSIQRRHERPRGGCFIDEPRRRMRRRVGVHLCLHRRASTRRLRTRRRRVRARPRARARSVKSPRRRRENENARPTERLA